MCKNRWVILIASCFVTLCIGSLYAWSVFATPLAEYIEKLTGEEITTMAIVFTIANAVGPITMISAGTFNDHLGPKWILIIGGILFGLGMIGTGYATSVTMVIVTYGLGVGLACGMIYGTIVSNTVKFFPDKAGLIGGLITACYGGSSILIPPLVTLLLNVIDVMNTFKIIGFVMMIILLCSSFIITKAPVYEYQSNSQLLDYTYKEMLKTPHFYIMLLVLTCGAFSGMMVISQASIISQRMMNFTFEEAAIIVSLIALANTLGRIISGVLSDKIGAISTLKITLSLSVIASIMMFICTDIVTFLFYLSILMIGFSFGSVMGVYPGFTAKEFGKRNNSVNYGIMFIGFALAGLFGPMMMNYIYSVYLSYQYAFLISATLNLIGLMLLFIFEKIKGEVKENG